MLIIPTCSYDQHSNGIVKFSKNSNVQIKASSKECCTKDRLWGAGERGTRIRTDEEVGPSRTWKHGRPLRDRCGR